MARGQYGLQRVVNLATALLDGLMSKTDKAKLDASTSANSANTLVQRSADGSIGVGNFTAAGGATVAGSLVANQTVQGNALSARSALIGGAGATPNNIVGMIPGADSDGSILIYGSNAANNVTRWYIRQDGYFSGIAQTSLNTSGNITGNAATATALSAGADRTKLDSIDTSVTDITMNSVLWKRKQLAPGKYMYTNQTAVTLPAAPDAIVLSDVTTPSSLPLSGYDMFCSYHGHNGGQINVSFRPLGNGEPNYNQNQFQVAISTMPNPASMSPVGPQAPVYHNLNAKGTTGVIHLMFIER